MANMISGQPRKLPHVIGLACLVTDVLHPAEELLYGSPSAPAPMANGGAGGLEFSPLEVRYDYKRIAKHLGSAEAFAKAPLAMHSYAALLPIPDASYLSPLAVGGTPFLRCPRLGKELGVDLFVKDESRNPSGSLKDRASALAVAHAQFFGRDRIAVASTGNAAASLASQAASAGVASVVFVPKTAPFAKIMQSVAYGSRVYAVEGNYDDAYALCQVACEHFGWYNRSTGFNPNMTEGKKTVSFEIAIQMAKYVGSKPMASPDAVFVSVGDGCIIGGVYKGFEDLLALGFIDKMPRIFGVQSEKSAAIYEAWRNDAPIAKVNATSRADSICADMPRDGLKALRAVRKSGASFVSVSDERILNAIVDLAQKEGIFAEPAAAASLAGVQAARAAGLVADGENVTILVTGSGLKDPFAAEHRLPRADSVSTLEDVLVNERRQGCPAYRP